jgi:hypothetical protein
MMINRNAAQQHACSKAYRHGRVAITVQGLVSARQIAGTRSEHI